MTSMQPVGVKSGNTGSEILGMDALSSNVVDVEWCPAARQGTLWIARPPFARASTGSGAFTRSDAAADTSSPPGTAPSGITDHGTWVDIGGVRLEKWLWDD